tara:strand:- start:11367 stop:11792 length:426 start_codon:yes stop_codon:yes gene_type:complete
MLFIVIPLLFTPFTQVIPIGSSGEQIKGEHYAASSIIHSEGMLVSMGDWYVIDQTMRSTVRNCKAVIEKSITHCKEDLDTLNKECKDHSPDQQAIIDAITLDNTKLKKELEESKKSGKMLTYISIGAGIVTTGLTAYLVVK